jgi:uncharacterized protein (DUF697 family)
MNGDTHQPTTVPSKAALNKLMRNHMIASAGAGLIPVPFADLAALTGVQLNLVRKIATAYGVPFSEHKAKSVIGALIAGALPLYGAPSVASLAKLIPVVGTAMGLVTTPTLCVAATYAVGQIFIQHFESGGTLLSFDAVKALDVFKGLFKKGEEVARDLSAETPSPDDSTPEPSEAHPAETSGDDVPSPKPKQTQ